MLALADDAALARLVIAAIAIPGRARLQLSDGAVEGLAARPRIVSERLISLRHRPSTAAATPCPTLTAVATAPSPTAAARSNCSRPPLTAAPRRSCWRTACSRPRRPNAWSPQASRSRSRGWASPRQGAERSQQTNEPTSLHHRCDTLLLACCGGDLASCLRSCLGSITNKRGTCTL